MMTVTMMRHTLILMIFLVGMASAGCASNRSVAAGLALGSGVFEFSGPTALNSDTMQVFYHRPQGDVTEMPILFVMHGVRRNADTYRDNWVDLSERYGVLVVVPEFSQALFPRARSYNHGNLLNANGDRNPEEQWSFTLIDPIFEELVRLTNSRQTGYDMFGHSAGSQFVHRFFLFMENVKLERIVASNAGTYTMLKQDIAYPFGLLGVDLSESRLKALLERKLIIQLGEADNDPEHPNLNTSEEAMRQGEHRFERGMNFYRQGKALAEQLQVDFGWKLRTVPGVAHKNAEMAQDIAGFLFDNKKQ